MNLYGLDHSAFDLGFADPCLDDYLSLSHEMIIDRRRGQREEENLLNLSNSLLKNSKRTSSPPKHRHDGTSPLPLGMDWSPPPRNWDGPNAVWPHDYHSGWSYCVTVPTWSILSESEGSEPAVFYRVKVGLQSPRGVTTTQEVLRRFSDFLELSSDLKRSFRKKKLPPTPPKGLLRMKSKTLLEERRCSLDDWMTKVLSDIDFSRSAPVACFLELEAVARLSFRESSDSVSNVSLSCNSSSSSDPVSSHSDCSVPARPSALGSANGPTDETSKIGSDLNLKDKCSEIGKGNPIYIGDLVNSREATVNEASCKNDDVTLSKEFSEEEERCLQTLDGRINLDKSRIGASLTFSHHHDGTENSQGLKNSSLASHAKGLLGMSPPEDTSFARPNEISNLWEVYEQNVTPSKCSESLEASECLAMLTRSDLHFSHDTLAVLPKDEQQKSQLLATTQQQLVPSKTDTEALIARLNQEPAVRLYLISKIKDLETELESTKKIGEDNLEQSICIDKERFTQMQRDMEELRRKCMVMEFRLKAKQDEKADAEVMKTLFAEESELSQQFDSTGEQLKNLQKCLEEAELKSKSDVKFLIKEVKSLQVSQSELRRELDRVSKEKTELGIRLQKERTKREHINATNAKLLHECEILRSRLEECNLSFVIDEENKLKMGAWSSPDALDILATSENQIGLLLAEAQLLAQDAATPVISSSYESDDMATTNDGLRKMLTDVLVNNASLRKQANSVLRCALNLSHMTNAFPGSSQIVKEDAP